MGFIHESLKGRLGEFSQDCVTRNYARVNDTSNMWQWMLQPDPHGKIWQPGVAIHPFQVLMLSCAHSCKQCICHPKETYLHSEQSDVWWQAPELTWCWGWQGLWWEEALVEKKCFPMGLKNAILENLFSEQFQKKEAAFQHTWGPLHQNGKLLSSVILHLPGIVSSNLFSQERHEKTINKWKTGNAFCTINIPHPAFFFFWRWNWK